MCEQILQLLQGPFSFSEHAYFPKHNVMSSCSLLVRFLKLPIQPGSKEEIHVDYGI